MLNSELLISSHLELFNKGIEILQETAKELASMLGKENVGKVDAQAGLLTFRFTGYRLYLRIELSATKLPSAEAETNFILGGKYKSETELGEPSLRCTYRQKDETGDKSWRIAEDAGVGSFLPFSQQAGMDPKAIFRAMILRSAGIAPVG